MVEHALQDGGGDSSRTCVDCGADIAVTANRCQQCGSTVAALPSSDAKAQLKRLLDRPWFLVVLILHVGLLGIPVYWRTKYSVGTRLLMIVISIVYTVAAVAFIVLMLRWLYRMFFGG